MEELRAWLQQLGLGQYLKLFSDNGIDLRALPHLTEQDFKQLGVLLGHRRILLSAVKGLTEQDKFADQAVDAGQSPPTVEAERRQVTILFADLVGYTHLSSQIDAEELHILLGHFLDAADAIILAHGGTIDKHLGDCVMAVFGAPVAHSNDPLRAVRAALAIQQAMPEVSKIAGRDLYAHIGIANGQVMASEVGNDAHYTVTGDSVNLASRLTDVAGKGEIILSPGVQMAVATEVELQNKGELKVKGIDLPVRAYSVLGLLESVSTENAPPFVGRQAELQQFSGLLEACKQTNSGQAVHVRGEAGIGKTRLSSKFCELANGMGFACHRALVLDFGAGKEQGVVQTLVRSLLSVPAQNTLEQRIRAVDRAFKQALLPSDLRVILNVLLDIPLDVQLRSLFDAMDSRGRELGKCTIVTTLLKNLSRRQPVLVFVEDIHWADRELLHFLAALTGNLMDQASSLVMTSRIEGDPLDQVWKQQTASTPFVTFDLRPLRPRDALALAVDYFDASSRFAQKCVERADGNPLYLEQLLRNAEDFGEDQVPGSVHSIVQARLDALQTADKQAIQAASVLGQQFLPVDLAYMMDDANYDCSVLLERQLIKPEDPGFLFSHALVQEAVYQSLLKSTRLKLHRMAAKCFAERDPELCARHLDRADDSDAAGAYLTAAQVRLTELQYESCLRLADRGIEFESDSKTYCELLLVRAEALRNQGAIEESLDACNAALEWAEPGQQQVVARLGLAESLRLADQQRRALETLDAAESMALEFDLKPQLTRIRYLRGNLYFMMGNLEGGCLEQHQASLALAEEIDSAEGMALALGGLGDAYYLGGRIRSACDQFQACIRLCREHGLGQVEVANRYMVGWSRFFLMEFSEAMNDAQASIEMARKVGHQRAEMIAIHLAGLIELERENFDASRACLQRGLTLAETLNAGHFVAQASFILARLEMAKGNHPAAQNHTDMALARVRDVGLAFAGPAVLATAAALSDDPQSRADLLREAESILDTGCVSHNHFQFARIAIDLQYKLKDWTAIERYIKRLQTYTADQSLAWSDYLMARGRVLIAWGQGERSPALQNEVARLREQGAEQGLDLLSILVEDGRA